jgi:hypothetical protein
MVAEGLPAPVACRVLEVSESGFYAWRTRTPSARSLRHAWLTEQIRQIHDQFRGVYGYRRVHAELTLGHGVPVGAEAVALLMRRAGLAGVTGRPKFRRIPNQPTARDHVERDFSRDEPDRLWVTDITEHPTREGKVYCAVVLDTFSRRVVGWSIDSSPNAALVTNALGMALSQRTPTGGTVIHSDQGTQGELNWSSQHSMMEVCSMATMKERQRQVQLYRGQVPSPGAPTVAWREDRVRFWTAIAHGVKTDEAAVDAGVSSPVGYRWFRHAGGVNPCLPPTVSGRYLSFSEREDIALLKAQGHGVREIARRVNRDPSTISRELRRNASTRTWKLEYKPSIAQWHGAAQTLVDGGCGIRRPARRCCVGRVRTRPGSVCRVRVGGVDGCRSVRSR